MHHQNRIFFYTFVILFCVLIFSNDTNAQVNLIPNPSLESSSASGLPTSWAKGKWGTSTAVFSYPVAGFSSVKAAKVELISRTSGDAKWYFNEVAVKPDTSYTFSDSYISNVGTFVTVQYRLSDGTFSWSDIAAPTPSSAWVATNASFVTPSNAVALTIFHLINRVGQLTVDNYSLTEESVTGSKGLLTFNFDDGWRSTYTNVVPILNSNSKLKSTFYLNSRFSFPAYIDQNQILALQSAGHEIGGHTRNHIDLTTLSSEQASTEVNGNVADLKGIGINKVETFAYPFGSYNSSTDSLIKSAGFIGARTSNGGSNGASSDRFLLARQGINLDVSVDQVKKWIDDAAAQDKWLILVFHHVDNSGEFYSTTPERFQAIADYAIAKNIPMAPMAEAIRRTYLR